MVQFREGKQNVLHELGYKIFLDRYALKDVTRESLAVGDTVIVVVDSHTAQREVGKVKRLDLPQVTVELLDGEIVKRDLEHVDKPLETNPEQMMERVAAGIASIEATPDLQEIWSEKFRWLLDGWKFVPGGRILTGAGTDQSLTYYNCMPPEQEILTKDGYMPIAEVKVGDYVVTHRNRLRKVLHKFERETEEDIYIIKSSKVRFDDLRVTGEHKIWSIRSEWVNGYRLSESLCLTQEPQWVPAQDLCKGDYVAVAYNGEVRSVDTIKISDYIGVETFLEDHIYPDHPILSEYDIHEVADDKLINVSLYTHKKRRVGTYLSPLNNDLSLDSELCYLFGRWLGDGCVTHRTGTDIPSGIKVVFNLTELDEAQEIADIFERRFGILPDIKLSRTGHWYDLWVNSMPIGEFFKSFMGCYSYAKYIPNVLMNLPHDSALALLRGLFKAEGYRANNTLGIVLSNRGLAIQIHQLLLRLGYLFSIEESALSLKKGPTYRIQATANECSDLFAQLFGVTLPEHEIGPKDYIEYGGLKWIRIQDIETESYRGHVLDIEVEEDHSFISAGVVVSNCYVIPSPHDSREGIMETLRQMTEIMSRGGGVGINISTLRPRHAYVKGVNGRSSGSVSWGALYSFVTGLIEQGGSRRGALMLILNDWHPDVFDFINSKRQMDNITNANISVGVSDKLMEAVKDDGEWELVFPDTMDPDYDELWDGDLETWMAAGRKVQHFKTVKACDLWNAIIESAWASAEPGVWFRERSNKMANSWYFNPLISTNPCFTGETRIHTNCGLVKAIDLFNDETEIEVAVDGRFSLRGTTAPASRVFRTGTKPVYRMQTEEGYTVRATADHRFMTPSGWAELQDLRPGDKIHILNRKGGFGQEGTLELGCILGWLVGDGGIESDRVVLSCFTGEKRRLAPVFAQHINRLLEPLTVGVQDYNGGIVEVMEKGETHVRSTYLLKLVDECGLVGNKFQVPEIVFKGTEDMQRGFLQALFTADGSVQVSNGVLNIRLSSNHLSLLEQVQVLLINFGIASTIYQNHREVQHHPIPNGKRDLNKHWVNTQHELSISKQNLVRFKNEIEFILERKTEALNRYLADYSTGVYSESFTATVQHILEDGIEDVYDLTEPLTHSIVINGMVAHNCGEQPLGAFSVCNLGAINLAKFYDETTDDVDWKTLGRAITYAIRFLDNVIDSTPYFFEENAYVQGGERRVGLGTMGIAELMIRKHIRYGSGESVEFIDKIYKFIAEAAYRTSAQLAEEKGAFPKFDVEKYLESGYMQQMPSDVREMIREKGSRNVTLLTQAPTGTTGTMVNTSTGIEPFFSWMYYRKSRLGLHEEQVPLVKEWYDAHPEALELPDYFVTAMDLTPKEHVQVQAAFQRWIDSAISKTCNVPNDYTIEQISELYEYMYDLGCKGGTIYRDGSRQEQVLMLKEDKEEKPEKVERVTTPHRVYPRPDKLSGVTINCPTPFGRAYVTMNSDEHGYPFEVFITAPGKAGSDLQADAEGLGRMISLSLRTTEPHNRLDMIKLIIDQLRDIGGARSVGFGQRRVISLPDSVARSLEAHFFPQNQVQQLGLPMADMPASTPISEIVDPTPSGNGIISGADLCPSCATISLIRAEGCRKCLTCGYSEC